MIRQDTVCYPPVSSPKKRSLGKQGAPNPSCHTVVTQFTVRKQYADFFGSASGILRDCFDSASDVLRDRFDCASASCRSTVEQQSNSSRRAVEDIPNTCRRRVEQQSNAYRRNAVRLTCFANLNPPSSLTFFQLRF